MFEVGDEEDARGKDFNKYEEVFLYEDRTSLLGICDLSRRIEDGSREGKGYKIMAFSKVHF
jgi:hypothetical protein